MSAAHTYTPGGLATKYRYTENVVFSHFDSLAIDESTSCQILLNSHFPIFLAGFPIFPANSSTISFSNQVGAYEDFRPNFSPAPSPADVHVGPVLTDSTL